MVANFGEKTLSKSLELTSLLRKNNLPTIFYPNSDKIGKQFKYASDKNIPFVALIGDDELINRTVTIKNMSTSEQKTISQNEILDFVLK